MAYETELRPKMTLQVIKVRDGKVVSDSGVRGFEGGEAGTATKDSDFPPCICPSCRPPRGRR